MIERCPHGWEMQPTDECGDCVRSERDDLTMLVRRMLKYAPIPLADQARDYLQRHHLQGSPLRSQSEGHAAMNQQEQFETWAKAIRSNLNLAKENGVGPNYVAAETRWAWIGWQACSQSNPKGGDAK